MPTPKRHTRAMMVKEVKQVLARTPQTRRFFSTYKAMGGQYSYKTLHRVLGSWSDVLVAAGLRRLDKPAHTSDIPCLRCDRPFPSWDVKCNRICESCKDTDGWQSGKVQRVVGYEFVE